MIDFNKPLRMKNGKKVTLIGKDISEALMKLLDGNHVHVDADRDTVVVKDEHGEVYGYNSAGRYISDEFGSSHDLENYEENKVVYRAVTLNSLKELKGKDASTTLANGVRVILSASEFSTAAAARNHFWRTGMVVRQERDGDGKVVSTAIVHTS